MIIKNSLFLFILSFLFITAKAYKVDSICGFYTLSKGKTINNINDRDVYRYDINGNIVSHVYLYWYEVSKNWSSGNKDTFIYNNNNKLQQIISVVWKQQTQTWEKEGQKTTYTYDTKGRLVSEVLGYTNKNDTSMLQTYAYNDQNKLVAYLQKFDWGWGKKLENKFKSNLTYFANGLLKDSTNQNWYSGDTAWEIPSIYEYTYNSKGQILNVIYHTYWESDKTWYENNKIDYTYDVDGRLKSYMIYEYVRLTTIHYWRPITNYIFENLSPQVVKKTRMEFELVKSNWYTYFIETTKINSVDSAEEIFYVENDSDGDLKYKTLLKIKRDSFYNVVSIEKFYKNNLSDTSLWDNADIKYHYYKTKNIRILTPNGGESYQNDSIVKISWMSTGVTKFRVEFLNDKNNWVLIDSNLSVTDSILFWKAPNIKTSLCKIRVIDINDSLVFDKSDKYFSLKNNTTQIIEPKNNNLEIVVYPNPTIDKIVIDGEFTDAILYDPNGKVVDVFYSNQQTLQGIKPGIYFIRINRKENFSVIKKIIIEQ